MKNLALAVLIAILITYSLGYIATDLFDISIHLDSDSIEPVPSLMLLIVLGVLFVMVGFVVALSIMAALGLAVFAVIGALVFVGFSGIWPILIAVIIVLWALKDKGRPQHDA